MLYGVTWDIDRSYFCPCS